ncbi:MAG: hypothetical protein P4M15_11485 [Alphaproteobacteria bacterium]|nr:hypothetical protein [Alphaproteobacteria bacterium]
MTNASLVRANYDPARSRLLLETPHIEIENASYIPRKITDALTRYAKSAGFPFSENTASSLYLDTDRFDLLRNGYTLRVRLGAASKVVKFRREKLTDEIFPNQIAVKGRHYEFQAVADEVAGRLHPNLSNAGIYPYIRREIEGPHDWPRDAMELRFSDLPYQKGGSPDSGVGNLIAWLIGEGRMGDMKRSQDLVLRPKVTTTVPRERTLFYIDANKPVNFIDHWPSPEPTAQMRKSGEYLCIEVAIDECVSRQPPQIKISDIVATTGNGFRTLNFKRLGKSSPFEREVKAEESGRNLTDEQMIGKYAEFGIALSDFANHMSRYPTFAHYKNSVRPLGSKAATAYGEHPECRGDGAFADLYASVAAFVP